MLETVNIREIEQQIHEYSERGDCLILQYYNNWVNLLEESGKLLQQCRRLKQVNQMLLCLLNSNSQFSVGDMVKAIDFGEDINEWGVFVIQEVWGDKYRLSPLGRDDAFNYHDKTSDEFFWVERNEIVSVTL